MNVGQLGIKPTTSHSTFKCPTNWALSNQMEVALLHVHVYSSKQLAFVIELLEHKKLIKNIIDNERLLVSIHADYSMITLIPESLLASASPILASLLTCAVLAIPRACRYPCNNKWFTNYSASPHTVEPTLQPPRNLITSSSLVQPLYFGPN